MSTNAPDTATTPPARAHPGEQRLQERVGLKRPDWGSAGVSARIPRTAAAFLAERRLVAIAATDDDGRVWSSVLSGPAGFITALDETTVRSTQALPPGDPLHGQLTEGHHVGMLAIDPASRRRMRLNGRVGAPTDGLLVSSEQVYANCPKYIRSRQPTRDAPTNVNDTEPTAVHSKGLSRAQIAWIEAADTFFIGSVAEPYGADASHRGGSPGFVSATPTSVTWPEYLGNSMYMTLGNLELDPRCGLVFVDWEAGHTLHLTGRAVADWDPERANALPEALQVVDMKIAHVIEIAHHHPTGWRSGEFWRFTPPAPGRATRTAGD